MIQLLRHHEIDQTRWANCLARAYQPLVYAQAWYLDVVCGNNWEALVEIQGEAYVSVFPLPVKTLLVQKRVYQPLFTQQLGLITTPASQETTIEDYLALLPSSYAAVQYQLPWPTALPVTLPEPWHWRFRPNYELSLAPAYPDIQQQYSINLRRNLQKTAATSLKVGKIDSIDALLSLFQRTKGRELPELRPRHYQKLEQLHQAAQRQGVGQVYEVRQEEELLAAAFVLHTPHRVTFLFGASSLEGRRRNAIAFLLDQIIRQEAGSGKTFDFEGSEVPGVAKFYSGFGAQPVPYLSLSLQSKRTTVQWTLNVFTSLAKRLR
ncbi:hypothetical protein TH63_19625 [Rufibacter radiotolerans]|uniref:BioF2-like acetyltransferase domain-containing protein n=1 Tax=Rufibacter radiotolerans TaxID=1379910 RepID=A0A0H4VN65_9BACT|nr:GNAT family N-acetyltransferase [Rufibacter radiotolerans]AKQ47360.1 hypothetical protein TH63_19625 [Rufibacter radiotolerans]